MLEELRIRGLGVIEDALLPLGPGLTVVTGETGAGKTMVVTGLLLLFGGRADSARVRTGADQACVDGRMDIGTDATVRDRIVDCGGSLDDDTTLVLRRTVQSTGRSRGYVGGAPAPVAVLAELADRLVTVHGQSDQIRLTRPGQQRVTLDRYAGIDLAAYTSAYERWRAAVTELIERTVRIGELSREADLLQHGIAEIESVAPQPGEDVELSAHASRLRHADALRLAAMTAHDALLGDSEDPSSDAVDVSTLLSGARRVIAHQAGADGQLDELGDRLGELGALAAELGADFAQYRDHLDADPARLAAIEERRAQLAALVRKYGDGPSADLAAVLRWADDAARRLRAIDVSDEALAALEAERQAAQDDVLDQARELSARRHEAAGRLAQAVTAELAGLAMATAALSIEVRPRPAQAGLPSLAIDGGTVGISSDGADEVEFLLRPHGESPALPIGRGASGGELSRVMLAIELCLAGSDPVPTMVFDEVDAGVGGRAAVEVGRRLARLSRAHQVLVVTHLAQVAAYADRHIVVDKPAHAAERSVVASDVRIVNGEERVAELARMLAGTDSSTALEHAAELLAGAVEERAEVPSKPARRRRQ